MSKETKRPTHGPSRIIEKPKNFKQAIKKMFYSLKGNYAVIVIALIFAIISSVCTILIPDKLKDLVAVIGKAIPIKVGDNFINAGVPLDLEAIKNIIIFAGILLILYNIFDYISSVMMKVVTQRVSKKMRQDVSTKINKLPFCYIDKTTTGDILSRITNDIDTISQALNNSITTIVVSVIMLIGTTILMFITNWILALTTIVASLIGFLIMAIIMSKSQKFFIAQQKSMGEINGHIEEVYSGHNIVSVYNAKEETTKEFNKINKKLYNSGWKAQFLGGLMPPIMDFISNLSYVMVCIIGAVLTVSGYINFGVIVAFIMYAKLFTNPLTQLARVVTNLQSAAAASERVFEFLDEPELADESNKKQAKIDVAGIVEFKNVNFGYNPEKLIIKDFSAKIKPGQKVAIVGPTGAGKTTLVNLLMRFYEVNSGEILIDNTNINELSRDYIHNLFAMVLQDTWLFEGTVKENIIYNQKNVTDEQVVEACTACGIDHFIKTLPNGYDTILNDNTTISAGQKQLLTIARAMIQNAPMLILDEATSSVDTRTEVLISKAMDKLTDKKTSFVIAHRLSTIKNADLILVMQDGDIVESGKHKQLLEQNGFYATLYNSQFED